MNWFKKSHKKTILLKCKFHGPLTASANRMGFSTFGLSKQETEFNFWLPVYYSSAALHATAASLDLRTPPLSAQKIRRVGGGLLSQAHLLRDLKLFNVAIFKDGYFNDGNAEGCYFTVDNAEDCLFTDDKGVGSGGGTILSSPGPSALPRSLWCPSCPASSLLGLDKVATLLEVVVFEVTIVEVVDGKVATLSVAIIKVAVLEDGRVK